MNSYREKFCWPTFTNRDLGTLWQAFMGSSDAEMLGEVEAEQRARAHLAADLRGPKGDSSADQQVEQLRATGWMTAKEAAEYLRCPLSRVRKLTMTNELPVERDGRRVLYLRDELDAFIRAGGAISP